MSFTKPLPQWEAPGIEPPTSLRENGWKAGIKPPDEYFNYLQNKAYEALKELQEYAVHKDEMDLSGVATKEDLKVVKEDLTTHLADKANPHTVTKSQVGLGSVGNYGIATQVEAETGTSDAKYMTPLKVKQAVTKLTPKNVPNGYAGLDENGNLVNSLGNPISTREFIAEVSGMQLAEFSFLNIPQGYTGLEIFFDMKIKNGSSTNENLYIYYNGETPTDTSTRTIFTMTGSFGTNYSRYGNVGVFRIPLVKPTTSDRIIIGEGVGGNNARTMEVNSLKGPDVSLTSLLFRPAKAEARIDLLRFQLYGVK